jgi:hypothetical protein
MKQYQNVYFFCKSNIFSSLFSQDVYIYVHKKLKTYKTKNMMKMVLQPFEAQDLCK